MVSRWFGVLTETLWNSGRRLLDVPWVMLIPSFFGPSLSWWTFRRVKLSLGTMCIKTSQALIINLLWKESIFPECETSPLFPWDQHLIWSPSQSSTSIWETASYQLIPGGLAKQRNGGKGSKFHCCIVEKLPVPNSFNTGNCQKIKEHCQQQATQNIDVIWTTRKVQNLSTIQKRRSFRSFTFSNIPEAPYKRVRN